MGILALTLLSLGLSGYAIWRDKGLEWSFAVSTPPAPQGAPRFETVFDYSVDQGVAHAPAIALREGGADIVWFQGSSEAQPDVEIYRARLTRTPDGTWQADAPAAIITSPALADVFTPQQLVVTLGNTIENEAKPDSLYATVVSVGGWAMASVADVTMRDGHPVHARKLNLSPFLNRSFLVKSPMVAYADGSHGLPAYFEMGSTYGALVRFDEKGRVRDQRRMTGDGVKPIQPMVVPLDADRGVAFLRDFNDSGRLYVSRTADGGQSWSRAEATDIAHPNAPVAALPVSGGRLLMALNGGAQSADLLHLAVSEDDGATWRVIQTLDRKPGDARYPMLRRLDDGDILLVYSHGTKTGLRAVVMNEAWVAAQ
ncbi:MAG: exo-alpha-sialidase [Roseovarius gahaiensis]